LGVGGDATKSRGHRDSIDRPAGNRCYGGILLLAPVGRLLQPFKQKSPKKLYMPRQYTGRQYSGVRRKGHNRATEGEREKGRVSRF
jgi:hypothetical protein